MPSIEPATLADLEPLADLLGELFSQEVEMSVDRAKQRRGLRAILESPGVGQIFVARDDSQGAAQVLGMVSLLHTISTAEGGPVCWLEDMIVRADARAAGIGSRLLQHAIDYARSSGMLRITLLTDGANDRARRFYRRHGFEASGMATLRLML